MLLTMTIAVILVIVPLGALAFGSCWDGCCYACWILTGLLTAIRLSCFY